MNNTTNKKEALRTLMKTVVYSFAIFGLLFVLILVGVLKIMSPNMRIANIPDEAILSINFDNGYTEVRGDDFFAEFSGASVYSVFDLIRAINLATSDDRIKAISATVNVSSLGLAQIQDISSAIKNFKQSGKKAYIYSNSFGGLGQGNREYYLATIFDEIWLQPEAEIGITGINIEVPFFKDILQKFGIEPEFYSRYEYKTAVSSLISSDFSKYYKDELNKVGKGFYGQLVNEIALNRNMNTEAVKKAINEAPLYAKDALNLKFVDKLGYRQDFDKFLQEKYNAETVNIDDYMANVREYADNKIPLVAFVVLDGVISEGLSANNPLNEAIIGEDTVLKQIEELKTKENLKAVVLRINSPGGSYIASDNIRYALENLKKTKNVPIVVSMADYAASGGYFISLAADYVIAEPATLTGSIGVVGGKVVFDKLWKKLGIKWGEISFGDNAGILSLNHKFSAKEKEAFNKSLDRVYADFTQKVSQRRGFDDKKINEVARGRVWLGKDAYELGLVDAIGGIDMALFKAKELAQIKLGEEFSLEYYPRKQSFSEKLTKYIESGGGLPAMKVMQKYGIDPTDLNIIYRLKFDTVLPPLKVSM